MAFALVVAREDVRVDILPVLFELFAKFFSFGLSKSKEFLLLCNCDAAENCLWLATLGLEEPPPPNTPLEEL